MPMAPDNIWSVLYTVYSWFCFISFLNLPPAGKGSGIFPEAEQ